MLALVSKWFEENEEERREELGKEGSGLLWPSFLPTPQTEPGGNLRLKSVEGAGPPAAGRPLGGEA